MLQVVKVTLVVVSLSLKRDVAVGVAAHGQPHDPLAEIDDVEEDKQHLALLGRVNALMVHQLIAQVHTRVHKKHSQQIDCCESLERQYRSPDDFHRDKGTIIFLIGSHKSPMVHTHQ